MNRLCRRTSNLARDFTTTDESWGEAVVNVLRPCDDGYVNTWRKVVSFLSVNGVSGRTTRAYQDEAESAIGRLTADDEWSAVAALPDLITIGTDYTRDDDTEVATGGMLAAALVYPGVETSRLTGGVVATERNRGLGKCLLRVARASTPYSASVSVVTNATNTYANLALVREGYVPHYIRPDGTVSYRTTGSW